MPDDVKTLISPERAAYYEEISGHDLAPLWESMKRLVLPQPSPQSVPALWRFDEILPLLLRAGDVITAREAERRVLVLENPGLRGQSRLTQSLFAGLQLILPGEVAPAHRHAASAIRFVIHGSGAYTAVDGEKTVMRPGDFVMTPSWTWHDHGNDSADPMVWLDVLDMHIVNLFDASFQEHHNAETQRTRRQDGHSFAQFGQGILPITPPPVTTHSPIINYPFATLRPVLERLVRADELDASHGARVRYANPLTGGWAMPTMGPCIAMLPSGFAGAPYRSTDGTILVCVEGEGTTVVETPTEENTLRWRRGDVFVVPSWRRYRHRATTEAVLFSISDRPAQEALGLWREERG